MVTIARVLVVLCVLTGCGLPMPPNATPCEREPSSYECQVWAYNRAGG
jgi:hypothetical protein